MAEAERLRADTRDASNEVDSASLRAGAAEYLENEARAALREACGLLRGFMTPDGRGDRQSTVEFLAKHDPERK